MRQMQFDAFLTHSFRKEANLCNRSNWNLRQILMLATTDPFDSKKSEPYDWLTILYIWSIDNIFLSKPRFLAIKCIIFRDQTRGRSYLFECPNQSFSRCPNSTCFCQSLAFRLLSPQNAQIRIKIFHQWHNKMIKAKPSFQWALNPPTSIVGAESA